MIRHLEEKKENKRKGYNITKYGVSSMVAPLKKVGILEPPNSLINADPKKWHYGSSFNANEIRSNFKSFVKTLTNANIEILLMNVDENDIADSVFTYDASFITDFGAILLSPGKKLRVGETIIHKNFYKKHNIPIIGEISGDASAEGGDMFWLNNSTLIVGRGFRTNQSGINQLTKILRPFGVEILAFDLPVFSSPESCLHMMSLISLVDVKKALAKVSHLPVSLLQLLEKLKFRIIDAPNLEFIASSTLSINVLATSPGNCVMLSNFPKTQNALESEGVKVSTFDGTSLCIGCEGGPTCLTRPILRE